MAQLDMRLTGDQEVKRSIPTSLGNILLWRLITEYFLVILSLPLSQEWQLSISGKRMH